MPKREAFLHSACKENVQEFLNFIQLHKDNADPFDLEEVLQELPKTQREVLWERLTRLLLDTLAAFPMERWNNGMEDDSEDEMEVEVSADLKQTMAVIEGVTVVAVASVDVILEDDSYAVLLECANILNGMLSALPASEVPVRLAIHRLCEAWWQKGLEGREDLGRTAFVLCLERSLMLTNPGAEIQRLWNLHEVLQTLDFEAEESREVADLLLQCFLSAAHIRREEGRRLLTFLFSWNVKFIGMIHGTIKNQLQFFPKFIIEHVAEIYFRAWKKASDLFLQEIETTCIQDFMQFAVLLHRNSPVHGKVRQILSYVHKQKLRQGVDEMLYRLYKPILWRGLKATNSEVRANAALLFTEAFPLQDPSLSSENMDRAIQRQLDTLFSLLEDPQPLVRSTAVLGVCKILANYWDVIPPTILTDFLKKLVTELAADVNSADVRCSVFKCMTVILDNNMSHPLLEQLLPALKNSLHDQSEKVRVAFVDLLLKMKAVRAAKFWKVCSMEHLLARLAIDSAPVSKRMVNLLFNSFFPVNQSEEVWCERCVTLIQMNPAAARKFYQHAHAYTAPTNIAKLMLTIRRCLNACIQKNTQDETSGMDSSNKENTSVLEDILTLEDTATMASLLEVLVILWGSIRRSLELNQEALQYTTAKFASVLPEYFRVFQDERCTLPLILIASFIPAAAVPTFSCGVLSKLRRLEPGADASRYGTLIDCLCSWGQAAHITEVIGEWLSEGLPQKPGRRDSDRRVRIQETAEAKPELGLDYLEHLLTGTSERDRLLGLKQSQLNQLLKSLASWKSVLYTCLSSSEGASGQSHAETALRAFNLHGRLSAHLQHKFPEGRDYFLGLENSAAWVAERALPFMVAPDDGGVSPQQLALAKRAVESFLTVCRDVVMVGLADEEFKGQVLHLCSVVLLSEKGYQCMPLLLSVLKEVAEVCLAQFAQAQSDQLTVLLNVVANVFQKVLETVARKLRTQPDEGLLLCHSTMAVLGDFLNVLQDWKVANSEAINGVFSTLFAAVIVEIRHSLRKISCAEEVTTPETIQDLPPLSSSLLAVIFKSPRVTRSFLAETNSSVESEAIDGISGLAAIVHVLAVVRQSGKLRSDVKSIAVSVQRQLQKHYSITAEEIGNVERVIYESAVRTVNEILMP
ncbi:condensin-2 complex subunit G2 isoform X1 [Conger conger]|uniref:condensin-2 complex subunit G2 isoform X1 n=1 Tax=Conger conger TaxID=82655 RepID=UPI002A59EE9C|nr:condensin-2 complex subunit G2 isoform X1 [Conger conger]XP_061095490.1 condensin-2 complex subunit G2 isoform X1 [Conger conger]